MNPYEVLGIPYSATETEIKAAYRNAVKKHHPDKTGSTDTATIAAINEAFDILGDPEKKRAYDSGWHLFVPPPVEEDPKERHRRELRRRRHAEAQEEARLKREWERLMYRRLYQINVFIFVLASLSVVDEYLPSLTYDDHVVSESTMVQRVGRTKYYIAYLETEHFHFALPTGVNAISFEPGKRIQIYASPLLRIPTTVQVSYEGQTKAFEPSRTLYSFLIPFHYIVFAFSSLALVMRTQTSFSFQFAFAPPLLLLVAFMFYVLTF